MLGEALREALHDGSVSGGPLQSLSPAVAPRAVFVAAHHATLPRRLPGTWAALLGGVQALLQRGLTDQSSKARCRFSASCCAH